MRLFIAVKLPEQVVNNVSKMQTQLSRYTVKGDIVPEDNLHITLKFLGEVYSDKLYALYSLMDELPQFKAPTLSIQQVSTLKGANIVCAKIKCDSNILEIEKYLTQRLEKLDFTVEHRIYNPHITLMRRYSFNMPFSEVVKNITVFNKPFYGGEIVLYSTEFGKDGTAPTYTPLYTVQLK